MEHYNVSSSSLNPSSGAILTSHYNSSVGLGELFILGKDMSDTDEWDRHIIVHEWTHFFEDKVSRSDSMGGPHGAGDIKDLSLAFGEGFATAISGIVFGEVDTSSNSANSYIYGDSYWAATQSGGLVPYGYSFNMENGAKTAHGWFSEYSVIQIIFDLVDPMIEAHDTISKTLGDIMTVMIGNQKTTEARTSIFSFINNFKINHSSDSAQIDSLTTENLMEPVIDDFGSTEDYFAGWSSMSSVYEEITIGETTLALALGGNGYLYNDMKNNLHPFLATSSTRLTMYASNSGHSFSLSISNRGEAVDFTVNGNNYQTVGSSNGLFSFPVPTVIGETYIVRIFSNYNQSSAWGEMN